MSDQPAYGVRPRFAPIARQTVAEGIRQALTESIQTGELVPGQQLPAERALCEEFGVGRTTVREAIQGLLSVGVIERRGHRLHVSEQLPDVSFHHMDTRKDRVRELFEVRRIFEDSMVRLCIRRATSTDVDDICSIAGAFSPNMSLAEFRRQDRAFHWAIARGCGNPLLIEVYGKVLEILFRSEEFSSLLSDRSNARAVRQIISAATRAHQLIADAVLRRDENAAVQAVEDHLDDVETRMLRRMV